MSVQGPSIGVNPLALMISVAFAASFSYVLPVSTPPNAIVYAYARFSLVEMVTFINFVDRGVARGVRGCGPHRAALARGGKRAKMFLKIHVKIQIAITYVFPCNKNKALQLQQLSFK